VKTSQHGKIAAQGVSHLGSVDNPHLVDDYAAQFECQYEKFG